MLLSATELVLPSFIAGLVMVLAPCGLSVLPVFITVITGVSSQDRAVGEQRAQVLLRAFVFVITFTVLMTLIGLGLQQIVQFSQVSVRAIEIISGVLFALAGLTQIGLLHLRTLQLHFLIRKTPDWLLPFVAAVVLGVTWAPCIGPVLGAVLTYAAAPGSGIGGVAVIASFAVGHALPFLFLALVSQKIIHRLQNQARYLHVLQRTTWIVLLLLGLIMIFAGVGYLTSILPRTELFLENWL
jgi:cytochrome c-type biogenesis protein